jgi:hypothetical protein
MEDTFVEGINFGEASACYTGRCKPGEKVALPYKIARQTSFFEARGSIKRFTCSALLIKKHQ